MCEEKKSLQLRESRQSWAPFLKASFAPPGVTSTGRYNWAEDECSEHDSRFLSGSLWDSVSLYLPVPIFPQRLQRYS